jgi:hypothetical protein
MARTRLPAVLWPLMAGNLVIGTGAQWRSFCLLGFSLLVPGMPLGLSDGELVGGRLALGIVGLLFLLSATSAWQSITTGDKPCVFSQSTADHTTLSRDLMLCVLVAVLHSAGAFIL